MQSEASPTTGLSEEAVLASRAAHGPNELEAGSRWGFLVTLLDVAREPMFVLLLLAAGLYLALGRIEEALTLSAALVLVSLLSVYQSIRSDRALAALRDLSQPMVQVVRDGRRVEIPSEDLVLGDVMLVNEGEHVPADGKILQASDYTVDESILTGESVALSKNKGDQVFSGTSTMSGNAWITVTAVGPSTALGLIGKTLAGISTEKTPLQLQINRFVLRMAWIGLVAFLLICGINYARSGDWVTALLYGLTLAMSILPEEIPVAFSSFMALGAARLSRAGVLTKQASTVESLGSATVICTDKTGTITQEGMRLSQLYDAHTQQLIVLPNALSSTAQRLLEAARFASEDEPFDAMEKAIVEAYRASGDEAQAAIIADRFPMTHEYALSGQPPMMTHVRTDSTGIENISGKGALERMLAICQLDAAAVAHVRTVGSTLSQNGLRVLGVAGAVRKGGELPENQDDFSWTFLGMIALENPPKANAKTVLQAFADASIQVKMITGDYPETAQAIARQVGLPNPDKLLLGQQIMDLDESALRAQVGPTVVFARMFPEAKLRVVEALKANGEIVAMTGDGVNDGPALKAAHIGVAMGKRGTEVAKQAAAIVLVEDDLNSMVMAIAQGRKIYQNLRKAIAYIVSIHIPIILTVAVPLLAGWSFANLLTPIHVIFLELVMGPTCSIAFENEPAEPGQMQAPPRKADESFLGGKELLRSILQGLGISTAVLSVYYINMQQGQSIEVVRTLVFACLVMSNILLVLVNRSFTLSVWQTLTIPNRTLIFMLALTFVLLLATLFIPTLQSLFAFSAVSAYQLWWTGLAAFLGVAWIEVQKLLVRSRSLKA